MAGERVLAKSFARIFFRNTINIGLPVLEYDTDKINNGDTLRITPTRASSKTRPERSSVQPCRTP
jgi:3-isopropylmalate/(R)-2-methylmalate dehydratase small subunit